MAGRKSDSETSISEQIRARRSLQGQVNLSAVVVKDLKITTAIAVSALKKAVRSGASQATLAVRADELGAAVRRDKRVGAVRAASASKARRPAGSKQGRGK